MAQPTDYSTTIALIASLSGYGFQQALPYVARSPLLNGALWATALAAFIHAGVLLARNCLFVPAQFLPAIIVSKMIPKDDMRVRFLEQSGTVSQRVTISTEDGEKLDAVQILLPQGAASAPWIIWFNANGVPFEQVLPFAAEYGRALPANIIVFNYRGVGHSTGWPRVSGDLVADGRAVLNHVTKTFGTPLNRIILHGHSLGGGVVGGLGREFPQCIKINDRSFSGLEAEVLALMRLGLGTVMGAALGCLLSGCVYVLKWLAGENAPPLLQFFGLGSFIVSGLFLGWGMNRTGILDAITPVILRSMRWSMDAVTGWNPARDLVIYHRLDGMIPYRHASLHAALVNKFSSVQSFELTAEGDGGFCHMHPLNQVPSVWYAVVARVRALLSEK